MEATDAEIDRGVYELYGLTAEEIAIVEGVANSSRARQQAVAPAANRETIKRHRSLAVAALIFMPTSFPLAYLITFACYGTRLHGDEDGSVDRRHRTPGTAFLPPRRGWVITEQRQMKQGLYTLDRPRREIVLRALQQHCAHRNWRLFAAHVRSSHVHIVVAAEQAPERILSEVKAYASRALSGHDFQGGSRKRWARHGSSRYLWKPQHVAAAVEYVVHEQGEPMAVWYEE